MKKFLLAILAVMTIFAFCACGDTQEQTGLDGAEEVVTSDGDIIIVEEEPRYSSDGELIVEVELPASDGDLTE
ncbi:MAG: hypothetical protein IJO94_02300 [Firmicutes bacterium]|nr:hypothetical protein [Bacillota bacterium]MBQ6810219.1 hypothetical protein [Bacillota bacterium]